MRPGQSGIVLSLHCVSRHFNQSIMKNTVTSVIALSLSLTAAAQNYQSQNVSLLGHWFEPTMQAEPTYGIKYQGVWGWKNPVDNREYGIIGGNDGYYFIDVTNPANPILRDKVTGCQTDCIWHEIKTYDKYVYMVSDDGGGNCFQIADMSYLPDSVHIVHQGTSIFEQCHTIFVDGHYLYGGSVTRSNNTYYSMAVYDLLPNPESPTLVRTLNQDFNLPGTVHDMFVRNDTVYASGGFDGLYIYKFMGASMPFQQLATFTQYSEQGYNHSSVLTPNGNTLIFMDEVPSGLGVKSLDVSNLGNLTMNQVFRSTQGCTPHNPYLIGANTLVAAYYQDGLQIFNVSNPSNVVRTGYFDTDTLNGVNNNYPDPYHGCWGAYVDLPSGNVLASDMQNGLYVFDVSAAITSVTPVQSHVSQVQAYPNPFNNNFSINIGLDKAQEITYTIFDHTGRQISRISENLPAGPSLLEVQAEMLAAGHYTVQVEGESFAETVKLVKVK